MFTGIVVELGRVASPPRPSDAGGLLLALEHSHELGERLRVGDSLAVQGVCLTVLTSRDGLTRVELGLETLRRTLLGGLSRDDRVNLEPALRVGDPLGGHWVQGHVDGTLTVLSVEAEGGHRVMSLALPRGLAPYVVEKGSVTLDGVSLTVAGLGDESFSVALLPHTLEATTLGRLQPENQVHVEVDILAKYVERSLAARGTP
ncbi:MAG: riboflavin synthase [Thermoanaerobaculia bacterium]